ncbi:hypothetical protein F5144DRAFT_370820 [Chaetomium tenue]|uniref:Uncharacterized protein n=1 Tax=Chaetomium tenue TaxID=1854479 RepID=A0ACB7P397_9PEZI|nr:hypothetical protein F5144DRAFT_370820 [Chaetomium globosum]
MDWISGTGCIRILMHRWWLKNILCRARTERDSGGSWFVSSEDTSRSAQLRPSLPSNTLSTRNKKLAAPQFGGTPPPRFGHALQGFAGSTAADPLPKRTTFRCENEASISPCQFTENLASSASQLSFQKGRGVLRDRALGGLIACILSGLSLLASVPVGKWLAGRKELSQENRRRCQLQLLPVTNARSSDLRYPAQPRLAPSRTANRVGLGKTFLSSSAQARAFTCQATAGSEDDLGHSTSPPPHSRSRR